MSFAFAVIPYPPTVLRVTVPVTPPPVKPSPAVTPVIVPPIAVTSLNVKLPAPSVAKTQWIIHCTIMSSGLKSKSCNVGIACY